VCPSSIIIISPARSRQRNAKLGHQRSDSVEQQPVEKKTQTTNAHESHLSIIAHNAASKTSSHSSRVHHHNPCSLRKRGVSPLAAPLFRIGTESCLPGCKQQRKPRSLSMPVSVCWCKAKSTMIKLPHREPNVEKIWKKIRQKVCIVKTIAT